MRAVIETRVPSHVENLCQKGHQAADHARIRQQKCTGERAKEKMSVRPARSVERMRASSDESSAASPVLLECGPDACNSLEHSDS